MRAVSPKQARRLRQYSKLRSEFLAEHERCEFVAGCTQASTEVHHKRGRVGPLLLDTAHWLPLCHDHHAWTTEHPAMAVEMGMSELRVGAS